MLPCPLLLNRYNNPAFKITEDSDESHQDEDAEEDNYLDPERDYDLNNYPLQRLNYDEICQNPQ